MVSVYRIVLCLLDNSISFFLLPYPSIEIHNIFLKISKIWKLSTLVYYFQKNKFSDQQN